ncbi:MAG: hypothetical protein FGM25_15725 [Mycobacterium sp.]|nr:hypothetical protein [Mycobacterium sp.]
MSRLLSSMPANPISELLSGALLLLRRTLFNQLPSAAPTDLQELVNGDLEGNLNATDPEGDPLAYQVVEAPQYGTVTVDANGAFLYAPRPPDCPPGPGGCPKNPVSGLNDSFTVAVSDGGFNLLDPFSDRATEVTVRVQPTLPETPEVFPSPGPVLHPLGATYIPGCVPTKETCEVGVRT